MPDEQANQVRLRRHVSRLQLDAIFEMFAGAQRPTGFAGALGLAPHQLVCGQEVQGSACSSG